VRHRIVAVEAFDQRYPLPAGAGSDAMHVDPVYSYAVTALHLADGTMGTGLAFTLGRGNEVVVRAIQALAPLVVGHSLDDAMADFARFWRRLADDSQLRWLGPHKGAVHLALASVSAALVDAWSRCRGLPLWQLLLEMSPEELLRWVDLAYLEDFLSRPEALALLRDHRPADWRRHELPSLGYPAYDTSVGWLGYDLDRLVANCRRQVAAGFGALKIKVGSPRLEQDLERLAAVRAAVGAGVRVMTDANQCWTVAEAVAAGRALARWDPYWLEEPTHPDDVLGHQEISRAIAPVRVAAGECVANAVQFKNLIRAGAISIVQADVLRLGGLPEFLAVALLARKAGLPLVPHAGSDAGQIHLHLVAWQTIALGVEPHPLEYVPHLREQFAEPASVHGGCFVLPRAPGASTRLLGVPGERCNGVPDVCGAAVSAAGLQAGRPHHKPGLQAGRLHHKPGLQAGRPHHKPLP
jgi:L-fuconate dehydratase